MSKTGADGSISLEYDENITITSSTVLGGLDAKIEATGVPEQLGPAAFQLTFFRATDDSFGHVLMNIDPEVSLSMIFQALVDYINATGARAMNGTFGVQQDIVDRFPDETQT